VYTDVYKMLESGAVPPRARESLKAALYELMNATVERGSLTAEEIAEILDSEEVRVTGLE
jgi:hypothetical protein